MKEEFHFQRFGLDQHPFECSINFFASYSLNEACHGNHDGGFSGILLGRDSETGPLITNVLFLPSMLEDHERVAETTKSISELEGVHVTGMLTNKILLWYGSR